MEKRKLMNEDKARKEKKKRGLLGFHCFLLLEYTNTKEDKRRLKS